MLSTAIIIFREILEITMIVGIVLAATRGMAGRGQWIALGLAGGMTGAVLIAVFADSISQSLSGVGQEIFNAAILFSAAIMIGWTVLWMRKHAREMSTHIKQVGQQIISGKLPHYSLALIIGLAMLREGAEIVLFMYSMIISGQEITSIIYGSAIGLFIGLSCGVLLYFGLLKIPARYALKVTSWILVLLVAGLASQGAGYLSAAGYFASIPEKALWDTSAFISQDSIIGKTLHSLIGYSARPMPIELIFYVGTLVGLCILMSVGDRIKRPVSAVTALIFLCIINMPSPAHAMEYFYSSLPIVGAQANNYALIA
jgi:high-affinity iron transporter